MPVNDMDYNLDILREKFTVPQILSLFSVNWDGHSNISCLWHQDSHPSMEIFSDHGWCYSCGKWADIFSFTMKLGKMRFDDAVAFLLDKQGIVPEAIIRKAPKDYMGPLPLAIAEYYHKQLGAEQREYLHSRLFTDDTLDRFWIGYRGDYQAYTLPFWAGEPGKSEITALQYRIAPWAANRDRKYWWEPGRYKPCLYNVHLINPDCIILVFGTLDALLGAQDGLPMVSASGLNTFADPTKAESFMLRDALAGVAHKFVLPDATLTEFEPALRVACNIGAEMRFFPHNAEGKDYNDYRRSGRSTADFINEVMEYSVPIAEPIGAF